MVRLSVKSSYQDIFEFKEFAKWSASEKYLKDITWKSSERWRF